MGEFTLEQSLHSRRWFLAVCTGAAAAALASCKIIAIGTTGQPAGFDPTGYAQGIWASKAIPHFTDSAKPMAEVVAAVHKDLATAGSTYGYRPASEGSPWTFIVGGSVTVVSKNTQSRVGTLTVVLEGAHPPLEFHIQIGPVVRGNAIRDSLPFVSFKDFTNQLEFAEVGKALTALGMEAVAREAARIEPGQRVEFVGSLSLSSKADKLVVTPVSLKPVP